MAANMSKRVHLYLHISLILVVLESHGSYFVVICPRYYIYIHFIESLYEILEKLVGRKSMIL